MTQPYKKKLIEVAIPLEAINAHAEKEKNNPFLKGHPRSLHQWWARRPNTTARAVLFAQMIDDPSSSPEQFPTEESQEAERERLFDLIARGCGWGADVDRGALEELKSIAARCMGSKLDELNFYDPFCGGGAIPLEAKRIGLRSHASDLNPIALLITAGQIEVPEFCFGLPGANESFSSTRGSQGLQGVASDIVFYAGRMQAMAQERIGHLYPAIAVQSSKYTPSAYIWARTVPCPDPAFSGLNTPLIRSFSISSKKGKQIWLEPQKTPNGIAFVVKKEPADRFHSLRAPSVSKSGGECLISGAALPLDYIRRMADAGRMGAQLAAIVCDLPSGRTAFAVDDFAPVKIPPDQLSKVPSIPLPEKALGFRVQQYGMHDFRDIFSPRQQVCLQTFSELILEVWKLIADDFQKKFGISDKAEHYASTVCKYLQMSISKMADYNNTISCWNNNNMNVTHLFTKHAIPMSWDYCEVNPFANLMSFVSISQSVATSVENLPDGPLGTVFQHDAADSQERVSNAVISTDPPYYDNIGYADLSDLFYLWARDNLQTIEPSISTTLAVPKTEEAIASPFRHPTRSEAESWFMQKMQKAMQNLCSVASPSSPITIYYAFKQKEISDEGVSSPGWVSFLEGVLNSGLSVVATWPVRTERATRSVGIGTNALASSVLLVCRPRIKNAGVITRAEFIRTLKRELRPALSHLQAASITPADMPQSSIGPGMGIFSRYEAVIESDDKPMTVKSALQLINHELDDFIGGFQGEFDPETRFTITWFEQNGMNSGEYGNANSIAQARGISVESVKHAEIVESAAGKVRILQREELYSDWSPLSDPHLTVWECCQHVIRRLECDGEHAAAMLLKQVGPEMGDAIKDLAYCLYDISSNKRKDAKEATSYNSLIAVWTELTRQAAAIHDVSGDRQVAMNF
ncbi:DUF1156 domain-containing protein [Skermanella rosea]|uniref:DUF1156 domain-containing protein n=1 Tax=Skermanella rosea TaxID=1817965 RepID=UPI0019344501|nr:DUF1156 domain-containing protein [Skermanella rosea]UEM04724.1 DUF1156 domain-containing protein [Skermanella rosea]